MREHEKGRMRGEGNAAPETVFLDAAVRLITLGKERHPELEFFVDDSSLEELLRGLPMTIRETMRYQDYLSRFVWLGWGRKLPFSLRWLLHRLAEAPKKGAHFVLDYRLAQGIVKNSQLAQECLEGMRERLSWAWPASWAWPVGAYSKFKIWLEGDKVAFCCTKRD